jgi:hypothetical protein
MLLDWNNFKSRPASKAQKRHLHGLGILQHSIIEAMNTDEATEAIHLSRKLTQYEKNKKDKSSHISNGD